MARTVKGSFRERIQEGVEKVNLTESEGRNLVRMTQGHTFDGVGLEAKRIQVPNG